MHNNTACTSIIVAAALLAGCGSMQSSSTGTGALAGSSSWRGGSTASGPLDPQNVAANINGHDLVRLRDVCLALGVHDGGSFSPPGMPADYARGPFSATILRLEFDGHAGRSSAASTFLGAARAEGGGPDAVVRIGDPAGWDWRLLAFTDTPSGWTFVGSIDLPQYRYGRPAPESVVLGPGKAWLAVKSQEGGAGTGFADEATTWYEVRNDRLAEALRIPARGFRSDGRMPFDVTYQGEIIDTYLTAQGLAAVRVRYEAVYTNARRDSMPGLKELFRKRGVATYVQNAATGRFEIDKATSPWAQGELETLVSATSDDLVRYNQQRLLGMARSPIQECRQWVGRLLLECSESEAKTALADELDAAQGG